MITFFNSTQNTTLAVQSETTLSQQDLNKLLWLFNNATAQPNTFVNGIFVGPRHEMITPWSTNAVEITQNMGINGITRIEEFILTTDQQPQHDPMLQQVYHRLDQHVFDVEQLPQPVIYVDNITDYNQQEGLALSTDEIQYLDSVSKQLGRKLTDSEVFGFSQVNSEHCRHKLFNAKCIIDGHEKTSMFELIKQTSQKNPNFLISAYKDNVAFNKGPKIKQFAPASGDKPDFYIVKEINTAIALKAETHNFPTTVEPFNGAATGTGGEIRDRLAGGKASLPLAGTAVYMTPYTRLDPTKTWEQNIDPRKWKYQSPEQILIKASNGASHFGNQFGQPLICGSVLTFEHEERYVTYAYDKVVMMAGGVGFANQRDAIKEKPKAGEKIVVMGGDNYRIGMGGGAVSSVNTGLYDNKIELNAVQRANPDMQKRVANVIRSVAEADNNPIVSIHDHGAGGHLNCISELVENTGGHVDMDQLPIGDKTLSAKEIIGNESQERMGLIVKEHDIELLQRIAERERAPLYVVGETTNDHKLVFQQNDGTKPVDLELDFLFGKTPQLTITDDHEYIPFQVADYCKNDEVITCLENVLKLEAVGCKDWLTNKVDRSVTGKVARQQCQGEIQLPLSDLGAVALDYTGTVGIATSIGHAPQVAPVSPSGATAMAMGEVLTNIVLAPLTHGLKGVSLSANWMWATGHKGEDARLYYAVEEANLIASRLGINIPTGKDSLSMTQNYGKQQVRAPGTVIFSAAAEVSNVQKIVSPVIKNVPDSTIYFVDFSMYVPAVGGSAYAQVKNTIGTDIPNVRALHYFKQTFEFVQEAVKQELILAGHDVSAGGKIVTLLEMCFANTTGGLEIDLDVIPRAYEIATALFAENVGVFVQVENSKAKKFYLLSQKNDLAVHNVGYPIEERLVNVTFKGEHFSFDIDQLRDVWFAPSLTLDQLQSDNNCAQIRFQNYKAQPLKFQFLANFTGTLEHFNLTHNRTQKSGITAAVIREKGTQCERETAYALYLAGFDVLDVHTTDLASGRENLENVNLIVFCGGFSNSDVLGSAKGWAGAFLYNENAKKSLDNYYKRNDTLSLGICNGCQLMAELELVYPEHEIKHKMMPNDSRKFESAFVSVTIPENHSVMLGSLSGTTLGAWVAHGEGKFKFPYEESKYHIVAKYLYDEYPGNPNGSDWNVAAVCSHDGRHLAIMPHPERSIFPWQCAHYPDEHNDDEVTPWIEAFVNARKWIELQSENNIKL